MANAVPEVSARLCCEKCGRPFEDFMEKHGITINFRELWRNEQSIILTDRESQIVETLLRSYPHAVHKDRIFLNVWGGSSDVQPKTLDVFICKLRKALAPIGMLIETVHGMGFRLKLESHSA